MSQIHPVTIDSHLLSQVTGGTAPPPNPPPTPIANAAKRARKAVNNLIARKPLVDQCGLPDPDGSSEHIVGRTANGDPYEMTNNSPYATCVAAATGK
jgi:hypothetical protein